MNSVVHHEMVRLLSGHCDGEITDSEQARLEELLSDDAECRNFYLEFMDVHSQLLFVSQRGELAPQQTACASANPPSAALSLPAAQTGEKVSRAARYYQHFLVAVGTLAACVLVQVYWSFPTVADQASVKPPNSVAVPFDPVQYVATVRGVIDCVWDDPADAMIIGVRLEAGDLRIPNGVANVQFDSGPELVVEGPAQLRLESNSSATVLSGKVVLRADELAAPFDLYTPISILAETSTEFAVNVGKEAEEIHVFQGEVRRKPKTAGKGAAPESLKAGDARRYETKANFFGRPTPCNPKGFVRHVPRPGPGAFGPHGNLLCYEGFNYPSKSALTMGKANGGKGWAGPWKAGFSRSFTDPERPRFPLNNREGLVRPGKFAPAGGGSFDYAGFTTAWRRMAHPVRLDTDGDYYVSFLFQRHGPPADPANAVALLFWTHEDFQTHRFEDVRQRLYIGVKKANQLTTRLQRMDTQAPIGINNGVPYLLIAKIAASRAGADRLFVRVYGPEETVNREEPTQWSLQSSPFQSDLAFDWLQVHINSHTRQTIDEIRLGTTWSSVTSAYLKKT